MACAITFDDGWSDNHQYAFPVLIDTGTPATVFLVAEMIGTDGKFWPERMARLLNTMADAGAHAWSGLHARWLREIPTRYRFSGTPPTRDELAEIIKGAKSFPDHEIRHRLSALEQELGVAAPAAGNEASLLNWAQVNEMITSGLVEAGSHTCNHIRLSADIPATLLEQEIVHSKELIWDNTRNEAKTFCYPNGVMCDHASELVSRHYTGAVTTHGGWNSSKTPNNALRRIGLHEDVSADRISFLARISGWL
jgi:peptidoglycan/xylan/chitin deacetylase (PgdA/CDA1 family)